MALEQTVTVKGASINNAYLKLTRTNISSQPNTNPKVPQPATIFTGTVQLGVFASKAMADANISNALDFINVTIPNFTTISVSANVVASLYTYLKTLPQFSSATSI